MDVDSINALPFPDPSRMTKQQELGGGWDVPLSAEEECGAAAHERSGREEQREEAVGGPASGSYGASMLLTPPASLPTSQRHPSLLPDSPVSVRPEGPFARPLQTNGAEELLSEREQEPGRRVEEEEGQRGMTPPFRLDDEVAVEGNEMQIDEEAPNPFSSTRPIPRPIRSRYASSHASSASLDLDLDLDLDFATAPPLSPSSASMTTLPLITPASLPAHKRSHSQVSPASSAGRTPSPAQVGQLILEETESAIDPFHLALSGLARSPSPDLALDVDFDVSLSPRSSFSTSTATLPTLPSAAATAAPTLTSFLSYDSQRARPLAPLAPTTSFTSVLASGTRATTPTAAPTGESSGSGLLRRRARSSTANSTSAFTLSASAGNASSGNAPGAHTGERSTSSKRRRSGTLSLSFGGGSGNDSTGTFTLSGNNEGTASGSGRRSSAAAPRLSLGCFPAGGTGAEEWTSPALRPPPGSSAPPAQTPTLSLLRPRSPTVRPFLSPAAAEAAPASSNPALFPTLPLSASTTTSTPVEPANEASFRRLAQRSSALQAHGEELLREAEGALRRAEGTIAGIEAEERERRREEEVRERLVSPPTGRPAEAHRNGQVIVGVRRGEGWGSRSSSTTASAPPTASRHRRRSSLFGSLGGGGSPATTLPALATTTTATSNGPALRSPTSPPRASPSAFSSAFNAIPTSPTSPAGSTSTSISTSTTRARQFLTQLRARRPRLSRNGTTVSPPLSPAEQQREEQRESGAHGSFFPLRGVEADASTMTVRARPVARAASAVEDWHPPSVTADFPSVAGSTDTPMPPDPPSGPFTLVRSLTLPSPPPLTDPSPAHEALSSYDESAELAAAARLNERVLERRRVSERLELGRTPSPFPFLPSAFSLNAFFATDEVSDREGRLWGEREGGGGGSSGRTLRGPTQSANERWRRGERPFSTAGTTTTTATGTALASATVSASSSSLASSGAGRSIASSHARTGQGGEAREARWSTPLGLQRHGRQERQEGAGVALRRAQRSGERTSTEEGDRQWWRVEESPSPPQPRRTSEERRAHRTPSFLDSQPLSSSATTASTARATDTSSASLNARAPPFRLPRPALAAPPCLRSGHSLFADDEEEAPLSQDSEGGRFSGLGGWAAPTLPLSKIRVTEDPETDCGRSNTQTDPNQPSRLPSFSFETSRASSSSSRRLMPWDDPEYVGSAAPRFDPFGDAPFLPPINGVAPSSSTSTRIGGAAPPRSSLADALARFDSRPASRDPDWRETLRRRHTNGTSPTRSGVEPTSPSSANNPIPGASTLASALDSVAAADARIATVEERLAQHRQSRMDRLAQMRRERNVVRSLLGGGGGAGASPPPLSPGEGQSRDFISGFEVGRQPQPTPGPSSPRRRTLDRLLRSLGGSGGGGERRGFAIWDDDFAGFFGLGGGRFGDSAALDPRNYLSDDTFDDSYEALLRLSERLGEAKPKGVPQSKLDQLRRFRYGEWPAGEREGEKEELEDEGLAGKGKGKERAKEGRLAVKGVEKEARCPVCLCDYEDDDAVLQTTCGHGFHEDCLVSWLKEHASCPVCRRDQAT
ncbi:hypothetical protein JCM11251_002865 [Rhodosporidiobolus azoricus]